MALAGHGEPNRAPGQPWRWPTPSTLAGTGRPQSTAAGPGQLQPAPADGTRQAWAADLADQRKLLLSVTPKGRRKYDQVVPESEKIYRSLEAKIGKVELNDFLNQLVALNTKLID